MREGQRTIIASWQCRSGLSQGLLLGRVIAEHQHAGDRAHSTKARKPSRKNRHGYTVPGAQNCAKRDCLLWERGVAFCHAITIQSQP